MIISRTSDIITDYINGSIFIQLLTDGCRTLEIKPYNWYKKFICVVVGVQFIVYQVQVNIAAKRFDLILGNEIKTLFRSTKIAYTHGYVYFWKLPYTIANIKDIADQAVK